MTKTVAEECGRKMIMKNNSNRLSMRPNSWLLSVFSSYLVENLCCFHSVTEQMEP